MVFCFLIQQKPVFECALTIHYSDEQFFQQKGPLSYKIFNTCRNKIYLKYIFKMSSFHQSAYCIAIAMIVRIFLLISLVSLESTGKSNKMYHIFRRLSLCKVLVQTVNQNHSIINFMIPQKQIIKTLLQLKKCGFYGFFLKFLAA